MQYPIAGVYQPIEDVVLLIDNVGAIITGQFAALTCALYDESNDVESAGLIVSEIGATGMYRVDFTPDAIGSWKTRWSSSNAAHYFAALQKVMVHVFDVRALPVDVADQVFDEQKAGHVAANSYGKIIQDLETDVAATHTHAAGGETQATEANTHAHAIDLKTASLTFTVAGVVDANVVDWKGAAAPALTGDAYAEAVLAHADAATAATQASEANAHAHTTDGHIQADYTGTEKTAINAVAGQITASQAVVTGAITTSEGNVRGADSDTLKTLSDQADGIEAHVHPLPAIPASQGDVTASQAVVTGAISTSQGVVTGAITAAQGVVTGAITATEAAIRGADSDDLKDISDEIAAIPSPVGMALETTAQSILSKVTPLPIDPAAESQLEAFILANCGGGGVSGVYTMAGI